MNYVVINTYYDDNNNIIAYLLQMSNGDTQYITVNDFEIFKNKKK
jgi:hypothetical protein